MEGKVSPARNRSDVARRKRVAFTWASSGVVDSSCPLPAPVFRIPMQASSKFASLARPRIWREYRYFLRQHPVWYLVPIGAALAAAIWAALSDGPPDPSFIYPIF